MNKPTLKRRSSTVKYELQSKGIMRLSAGKSLKPMLLITGNIWIPWSLGRAGSISRCDRCCPPKWGSIYGTIFYNWSSSIKDQEHFAETLKEDSEGSKTFPIARKISRTCQVLWLDGYFINQETTGNLVEPLGPKLRDFLLYTKEYAKSLNYPISIPGTML